MTILAELERANAEENLGEQHQRECGQLLPDHHGEHAGGGAARARRDLRAHRHGGVPAGRAVRPPRNAITRTQHHSKQSALFDTSGVNLAGMMPVC